MAAGRVDHSEPRARSHAQRVGIGSAGDAHLVIVVASRFDRLAARLVAACGERARLLTPEDLGSPGWIHHPGRPRDSRAVVGGRVVPYREISAVWSLLPWVSADELDFIVAADRSYVAAEMTAFLRAFVADVPAHVVNSGAGPLTWAWPPERWRWEAAGAGLTSAERAAAAEAVDQVASVTIVGSRATGDGRWTDGARRLATELQLDVLTVTFDRKGVVAGSLRPPLDDPEVVHALAAYLGEFA